MIKYACPAWVSAARTHVRRLQVLQSKRFLLLNADPTYVSSRQIHEDMCDPLLVEHIRALTESFEANLADVRNP
jgi:hypothetical protein